jgi:hypothetical protein
MFSKTKIALAAALIVGSASVAMADGEFDPNLGNRYPQATTQVLEGRNVAMTAAVSGQQAWIDRASRSFGGGY